MPSSVVTTEPFALRPGDSCAAGGDFGFRSDSSALVKAAIREGKLHVYGGIECKPEDGQPLKPGRTVAAFAECIAKQCGYVMADSHYRMAIVEHLETHDLAFAPAPVLPADTYVRARMLFREGRVCIHKASLPEGFADRLMLQLRQVQGKPTSGGGMSIVHQRWATGGHGDLASAFVLALWQLAGDKVPDEKPVMGTKEWEEAAQEDRRRQYLAERQRTATDWKARYGR